ncbi:unnamed protein product [Rotaria socialis]|nr:unnamed protein product [Rotaria socialis]
MNAAKSVSSSNVINAPRSMTSMAKKIDSSVKVENASQSDRRLIRRDDNHENLVFIRLDAEGSSSPNMLAFLRSINDSTRCYSTSSSCLDAIRSTKESVFFICSIYNIELLMTVHKMENVEAIFIVDSNPRDIKGDFPKLIGVFTQQEQLFRSLKDTVEIFEQIRLENFSFEEETSFLWYQLWRDEASDFFTSFKHRS